MHLGQRGRAALVGVVLLTVGGVVLGIVRAQYAASAVALLAGGALAVGLLIWGLISTVSRDVAELGQAAVQLKGRLTAIEKGVARNSQRQVRNVKLHQRTRQQIDSYSTRLEQLSMRVSFPALQGRSPGDPISTRFADYVDQPIMREGSRAEALLEQLTREMAERKAFEAFVRVNLPLHDDAQPPHRS